MAGTSENQNQSTSFTVQEKGEIYFFFKPKVDVVQPESLDDVQRMFVFVLRPQAAETSGKKGHLKEAHEKEESTPADLKKSDIANKEEEVKAEGKEGQFKEAHEKEESTLVDSKKPDAANKEAEEGEDMENFQKIEIGEKPVFRYVVMGRRCLPDVEKGKAKTYWGFVELVTTSAGDLKKVLCEEECETTLTLGRRVNPAARPVGEGRYSIAQIRKGNRQPSTTLAYKLVIPGPHKKHDPQDAKFIKHQASFIIQVKNPKQPTPAIANTANTANTGNKPPARLPAHLLGGVGVRPFVPLDPPDLLNYEGVELLLVSTYDVLLNTEVDAELKTSDSWTEEAPVYMEVAVAPKDQAKLIRPLFEGTWE